MWGAIALWFWFAFPFWLAVLSIFSYASWPSVHLLWRNVYLGLPPIFGLYLFLLLLLSCMSSLCILDINPLSDIWFANIFSHSVGYLLISWMVSFAVQKPFSFMKSYLFIFAFVAFVFGVRSKTSLPRLMSSSLPAMFSSRSFMVSGENNSTYNSIKKNKLPWNKVIHGDARLIQWKQQNVIERN